MSNASQDVTIGELRHRFSLMAPVPLDDGAGGHTITWSLAGEVWGALRPRQGRVVPASDGAEGRVTHEIWIRHREGLTRDNRFRLGATRVRDPRHHRRRIASSLSLLRSRGARCLMANMAAYDLQRAVFAKLAANAALVTKLGGTRIHDDVPGKPEYPFVSFGPQTEKDWSTGTEEGSEHTFNLHVWSLSRSREEITALADLVRIAVEALPQSTASYRIVTIRHEQTDIERMEAGSRLKATLRFRALVEPL